MAGIATIQPPAAPRPERLHHLSRAFGLLVAFRVEEEDCIVAQIGGREIVLPAETEPDLRPLVGCRIGVVRLDDQHIFRRLV